jgi:hypothetical protein
MNASALVRPVMQPWSTKEIPYPSSAEGILRPTLGHPSPVSSPKPRLLDLGFLRRRFFKPEHRPLRITKPTIAVAEAAAPCTPSKAPESHHRSFTRARWWSTAGNVNGELPLGKRHPYSDKPQFPTAATWYDGWLP